MHFLDCTEHYVIKQVVIMQLKLTPIDFIRRKNWVELNYLSEKDKQHYLWLVRHVTLVQEKLTLVKRVKKRQRLEQDELKH